MYAWISVLVSPTRCCLESRTYGLIYKPTCDTICWEISIQWRCYGLSRLWSGTLYLRRLLYEARGCESIYACRGSNSSSCCRYNDIPASFHPRSPVGHHYDPHIRHHHNTGGTTHIANTDVIKPLKYNNHNGNSRCGGCGFGWWSSVPVVSYHGLENPPGAQVPAATIYTRLESEFNHLASLRGPY